MPRARVVPALVVAALLLVIAGLILARGFAASAAGARLRRMAAAHGLSARWRDLDVTGGGRLRIVGLTVTSLARGDTVLVADSLGVALDPGALAALRLD